MMPRPDAQPKCATAELTHSLRLLASERVYIGDRHRATKLSTLSAQHELFAQAQRQRPQVPRKARPIPPQQTHR